jgi:hypothetical protein
MNDQVKAAQDMIIWARKHQVVLARVKVGDVEVDVLSMVVAAAPPSKLDEAKAKQNLYQQYGGEVIAELERAENESVVEDDDEP